MTQGDLSMRHVVPWPVVSVAALALSLVGHGTAVGQSPAAARERQPTPEQVAAQVRAVLRTVAEPKRLDLGWRGIQWLTGRDYEWGEQALDAVKRWVSRGNVCWMDIGLASRFGLVSEVAGAVDSAVLAEGAEKHPLAAGVREVRAPDRLRYLCGLPTGAQAILVASNSADHVVLAVWEVGRGVIVIRPPRRRSQDTWVHRSRREWIAPDLADGARLLHNLNTYSLDVLRRARRLPPADDSGSRTAGFQSLREAFHSGP